jgi:hypothetical protein
MQLINRDCLILRAKQSFADWTRSVPGLQMPDATLDDVNLEATVLLVPEGVNKHDALQYIDRFKPVLVRQLFAAWYLDESTWPDFDEYPFDHWISVEYSSMVHDMVVRKRIVKKKDNSLSRW